MNSAETQSGDGAATRVGQWISYSWTRPWVLQAVWEDGDGEASKGTSVLLSAERGAIAIKW